MAKPLKPLGAFLCCAALSLACATTTTEPALDEDDMVTKATAFPALMLLPEPASSEPEALPPQLDEGRALFQRAYELALAERFLEAAEGFLAAAQVLRVGIEHPYVQTLEAGRGAAYHNAYACFAAGGKEAEGRKKLAAIATDDVVMAVTIQGILAGQD